MRRSPPSAGSVLIGSGHPGAGQASLQNARARRAVAPYHRRTTVGVIMMMSYAVHRNTVDRTSTSFLGERMIKSFLEQLRTQRWDDHRYYHHSRINQSLHLLSALSFLTAYAFLFSNPALAALIAWLLAMTSRQAGHFFFEP